MDGCRIEQVYWELLTLNGSTENYGNHGEASFLALICMHWDSHGGASFSALICMHWDGHREASLETL